MKAKKVFEGLWEFPSWKPVPVGDGNTLSVWPQISGTGDWPLDDRFRLVIPNSRLIGIYNHHFQPGDVQYMTPWHSDGPMTDNATGEVSTHVLVMICCDNPKLGTEFSDEVERPLREYGVCDQTARKFTGKPWTPYLMRTDQIHRSPAGRWNFHRIMYRHFLKLDEAALDIDTNRV